MSLREEILATFSGEIGERPLYLPDLSLWYAWHHGRGTLPEEWKSYSLPEIAQVLDVPVWLAVRPYQIESRGVEIVTTENAGERIVRYETAVGTLVARWTLGPDGDWWQVEYPVKAADDLRAVLEVARARTYVLGFTQVERWQRLVGGNGIVALEIPRRPYSDLLHEFLGWSEGLLFLREPAVQEINGVLEAKLQEFVRSVAGLPGDLVLSPDNLDGQFISPKSFRQYLAESYQHTAGALHRGGKRLVVHVGGPVSRLLAPLAEVGVDGFEGVAGPPQGDLSLAAARETVGPEPVLWGGIPQDYALETHDWAEFEAAVSQAALEAHGDSRAILGVADRVPVNIDLDRLKAIPVLIERALGQ